MPRLLAIEWDSREARAVVASTGGGHATIEQAFSVPLATRAKAAAAGVDRQVGETIAEALAARRIGRADTLVGVGRASIELKQLSLPPAPDDELPDMVRFQAMREFHSLGEAWPLDFIPLSGGADAPRTVLAATISPELVEQSCGICRAAHLEPKRLVLRPCAAASLLCRARAAELPRVSLLVDILAEEADLTAIVGGQVAYLRTARLPADAASASPELARALLAEVRRTIAAVTQAAGERVQAIYLCGRDDEHAQLVERMTGELNVAVRSFDPFAGLSLARELAAHPPAAAGRFAPLVGMLIDEADGRKHDIDFLNPRQRPAPPNRKPFFAAIGAAVAAGVLLVGGALWWSLASLDGEIERLASQSRDMDPLVKRSQEISARAGEIAKWTDSEVVWLDELRNLSNKFPASQEAMITKLQMLPLTEAPGGKIHIEGLVRAAEGVDRLEAGLRDERRGVEGAGRQQVTDRQNYNWQFKSSIVVASAATSPETVVETAPTAARERLPTKAPAENAASAAPSAATPSAASGGASPARSAAIARQER